MKSVKPLLSVNSRPLHPEKLLEVYETLLKTFGHQGWWPGDTPFEMMIGAILTQNTAWKNVEKAIHQLKKAGIHSPQAMDDLPLSELAFLIRPAGYFNVKAARLKYFVHFFIQEYGGDVEKMKGESGEILREKILNIKGIGPETADSILLYALKKPYFVVDAYTKRIFLRHRLKHPLLIKKMNGRKGKTLLKDEYSAWQQVFNATLPRDTGLFNDFHAQIVRIGKDFCKASKVFCETCPLYKYL